MKVFHRRDGFWIEQQKKHMQRHVVRLGDHMFIEDLNRAESTLQKRDEEVDVHFYASYDSLCCPEDSFSFFFLNCPLLMTKQFKIIFLSGEAKYQKVS